MILVHLIRRNGIFRKRRTIRANSKQNLFTSWGHVRWPLLILFSVWIFSYSPCKTGFIKHILRYSFCFFFNSPFFILLWPLSCSWRLCLKKEKKRKVWDREGNRHRALECTKKEEILEHGNGFPLYARTAQGSETVGAALLDSVAWEALGVYRAAHAGDSWLWFRSIYVCDIIWKRKRLYRWVDHWCSWVSSSFCF